MVAFQFLCFSFSHNYNYEMNNNDISDQLCLIYRILWVGYNHKWWWALWMWGYEATLVNAYRMCFRYHKECQLQMPWTHYKFNKLTGCTWINPETDWPTCNRHRTIEKNGQKEGDWIQRRPK
eukprot:15048800-Ditylum_brightwellii.AAC.1